MPRQLACLFLLLALATTASAQDLTVYDDVLQNGFQDYSYGGGADFNSTAQVHSGTKSIAFTGNNFNALSFARPGNAVTTAAYPVLKFWIHGGAASNQQLRIYLQLNNAIVANAELDSYITSGAVAAGVWREVTVTFSQAPLSYSGSFDRIDLQSDIGGAQPTLYIDDMRLTQVAPVAADSMLIEHDVTVASMPSDRFTWRDSNNLPRVAALTHNNGAAGPGGVRGGALREFRYQLPDGTTRIAGVTTYGNGGYGGFGYAVAHASNYAGCVGDDSPLGSFVGGTFTRVFEGRHHAIFRFTQNYPRNCSTSAPVIARTIPITIDWVFSTGRDHPLWSITWHIDQTNPAAPANTFFDDSRAPYGELAIDGEGFADIDGVAWGDRYKFTSTTVPVTLDSQWTWNVVNTVPYVKLWINGPVVLPNHTEDATMGLVQSQTMTQQDAGGGRNEFYHDVTPFWNKTSANGNAGGAYVMPYQDSWPYQANAFSIGTGSGSNNNARLTWGTQYGFIGQTSYQVRDGVVATAPGYPKKSYSTYVVLGTHTSAPVEAQVTQIETIQTLTLSATVGSVVTSGPAGVNRVDNVTYAPAGYNHVYGALAFTASSNNLDANIGVGAGKTLRHPLIIVGNFTGSSPTVKLGNVTLVADADYFASARAASSELWITLNRDLTGATNRFEVITAGAPVAPGVPVGLVATGVTSTQVNLTWTATSGATSYEVDRRGAGGAFAQIAAPGTNSFADTTALADTAYLYRVRAVNGAGTSASSASDLATTVVFATGTTVQGVHVTQLRTATNAIRALAGLGSQVFTDPALAGVLIKGVHLTELRTALDAARGALSLSTGGYTDAAPAGVAVKAVHVQELRDRAQ